MRDERLAGGTLRRHRSGYGLAEDHGRPALGAPLRERGGRERARIRGACHHEGSKVITEQTLYQGLRCLVGVDEVCQAALDKVRRLSLGDSLHERACLLHVGVNRAQRREGGLGG